MYTVTQNVSKAIQNVPERTLNLPKNNSKCLKCLVHIDSELSKIVMKSMIKTVIMVLIPETT